MDTQPPYLCHRIPQGEFVFSSDTVIANWDRPQGMQPSRYQIAEELQDFIALT